MNEELISDLMEAVKRGMNGCISQSTLENLLPLVEEELRTYWAQQIAIIWTRDDVLQQWPDLTPDQVGQVLTYMQDNWDANEGVTWDSIDEAVTELGLDS